MIDFLKIEQGLGLLLARDGYLLEKNISERAITHKLGEHLQGLYPEWNVDCEFNKNLDNPKKFQIDPTNLLRQMAIHLEEYRGQEKLFMDSHLGVNGQDVQSLIRQLNKGKARYSKDLDLYLFTLELENGKKIRKTIYPDIIVHHRGTTDNHIVIEAKKRKTSPVFGGYGSRVEYLYDLVKLATLVSHPDYKYHKGIFVELPVGSDFGRTKYFARGNTVFTDVSEYQPVM